MADTMLKIRDLLGWQFVLFSHYAAPAYIDSAGSYLRLTGEYGHL